MKQSTRHTCIMIGIALLIVAGIMAYMSLSSPRVYVTEDMSTVPHSEYNDYVAPTTYNTKDMRLNLNTATAEELVTIDGIGYKMAAQIISYRDEIGGYTSVSQIKNIKGIGDATYDKLSPYLTV